MVEGQAGKAFCRPSSCATGLLAEIKVDPKQAPLKKTATESLRQVVERNHMFRWRYYDGPRNIMAIAFNGLSREFESFYGSSCRKIYNLSVAADRDARRLDILSRISFSRMT
ncbi:hypothetical protein K5M33_01070, partial [Chromobacterium vaccinii]|nr:hypothetical protein [Chromobacterium vaccinii]